MTLPRLIGWFCFALFANACSPQATAGPIVQVAISPAAQPVSAAIFACVPESVSVVFDVLYPSVVDLDIVDFYVQLGEADEPPEFAAQLATAHIVVVLHSDSALELTNGQIADLFSGRVTDWSELGGEAGKVELWVGPESDEARQAFEDLVLRGSPVAGTANLATNPEDVLAAVAADPTAAGLLPMAWADESVHTIELGIQLPVLALASQAPSGAARQLLACLQGEVGQKAMAELYKPLAP